MDTKLITKKKEKIYEKTLLQIAVENNNYEISKLLLSQKDIINEISFDFTKTLFHISIMNNNMDILHLLINKFDIRVFKIK